MLQIDWGILRKTKCLRKGVDTIGDRGAYEADDNTCDFRIGACLGHLREEAASELNDVHR